MDENIQRKIEEIMKMSDLTEAQDNRPVSTAKPRPDGLSMGIRTQEDADLFMAQLRAITGK